MSVVSISKASRLVGVSRATLLQVIDSGKIQTVPMEEDRAGVDTADLERIYGFLLPDSVADTTVLNDSPPIRPIHQENEAIREEMARMRGRMEQARARQDEAPSRSRSGLVLGFAGMLTLMVAVAVGYRWWQTAPGNAPLDNSSLATTPLADAPDPPPMDLPVVLPPPAADTASATPPAYIDSVVRDEPPAPTSEPAAGNLPETREVVAAVVPAGEIPISSAAEPPAATPPAAPPAPPVVSTTPPRSELGEFMAGMESGEYVVVVGSFPSAESAREGRDRLRGKHPELFQPALSPTAGNTQGHENFYQSGKFWVVYVGGFYSRASAERLREKAVSELGFRGDSFLQRPR